MKISNNIVDKGYTNLVNKIINNGVYKEDRTGIGTLSIFAVNLSWDLRNMFKFRNDNKSYYEFPMLTKKKQFFKNTAAETCWIWNGNTSIDYLQQYNCNIWNYNFDSDINKYKEERLLGPIYGFQLRHFNGNYDKQSGGIDQLNNLINGLINNPYSRRHVVSYWNPQQIDDMSLPPCHFCFLCDVHKENNKNVLSLIWNQRSCDVALGLPADISLYMTILYLLCEITGYEPGTLSCNIGDCHIYKNHIEGMNKFLNDIEFKESYSAPTLEIDNTNLKYNNSIVPVIEPNQLSLLNYKSNNFLKLKMSV